jgi:RNA polymerase primary sigma factor/RNA polymerase sigma factor
MPAIVVSLAEKKKPLTYFQQILRQKGLLDEMDRIIYDEIFDDEYYYDEILSPMPNLAEFEKKKTEEVKIKVKDMPLEIACLYGNPVLSREQEHHEFRKFNFLKYKAKKLQNKQSFAAEMATIRNLEEAIKVKKFLASCNVRLAMFAAKLRLRIIKVGNIFDLFAEANLSLMRCIPCFDFTMGDKFSTYATFAIARNFSNHRKNKEAPYEELFVNGIDTEFFEGILDDLSDLEKKETKQFNNSIIDKLLEQVSERQELVIRKYSQLNEEDKRPTLEQIGREISLSKERVRQVKELGFEKLAEIANSMTLDEFIKEFVK